MKNCKLKNKERKVKPLLYTDEPLCQEGYLACGDGNCIERGLFCNGEKDCADGSDENSCGELYFCATLKHSGSTLVSVVLYQTCVVGFSKFLRNKLSKKEFASDLPVPVDFRQVNCSPTTRRNER